jgi:hypothetical protein
VNAAFANLAVMPDKLTDAIAGLRALRADVVAVAEG